MSRAVPKKRLRVLAPLFGPLGESLAAIAFFDDILALDPDASILILVRQNAERIRDFASAYPQIEIRKIPAGIASIGFFLMLLRERWTLIALGVAEYYSLRLRFFFFMLSLTGSRTIGFDDRSSGEWRWLPLEVVLPLNEIVLSNKQYRLILPHLAGFRSVDLVRAYERPVTLKLRTRVPQDFRLEAGRYIVIHPVAMSVWRTFPSRRWKTILSAIAREYPNLALVFSGSEKDLTTLKDMASIIPGSLISTAPPLEVADIINKAALYIGVDTGITYLACVLQQKSIVISHCSQMRWRQLYNPNARVLVNSRRCTCGTDEECSVEVDGIRYHRCAADISDEFILTSVRAALASTERHVPSFGGFFDEGCDSTN